MTYAIMGVLLLILAFILLYKAELTDDTSHFFDLTNTTAMRGFWCIIVILVHIPAAYQNRIQDMIGSFAYIGVTFFFMTSAYGLKVGSEKNPDSIKVFWRRRLPKLLVPMFVVNFLGLIMSAIEGKDVSLSGLTYINTWVLWLLACYFIFWMIERIVPIRGGYQDVIICLLITIMSVFIYSQKDKISANTWCPEVFGFVWGIVLADSKKLFSSWVKNKWLLRCAVFCVVAGVLGVMYLKFKPMPFYGDYLLKIALGVAITVFILAVNVGAVFGNGTSLFLGKISYEVYLIHGSVFGLLSAFLPEVNSGVFIGLSVVITVALSWGVSSVSKPIIGGVNKILIKG